MKIRARCKRLGVLTKESGEGMAAAALLDLQCTLVLGKERYTVEVPAGASQFTISQRARDHPHPTDAILILMTLSEELSVICTSIP